MSYRSKSCLAFSVLLSWLCLSGTATAQIPKDVETGIDALVAQAYQVASAKLPCKVSTHSGSHMMDWKKIDKCMEQARLRIDWDELSSQLQALRKPNVSGGDFAAAVEQSFVRQAIPYNKLFRTGDKNALLPLTNSILKYAVQDTLIDKQVLPLKGKQAIGVLSGIFLYERTGAIATGGNYRLAMFQYTDPQGKMQTPSDKLLLDSFGVAWSEIESKPGFRFPVDFLPGIGRN